MITQQILKHRDSSCPMYNTCSSLGYISEVCSISCYLDTTQQEKKDKLLELYQTVLKQYVVEIDTPLQQHFTFLASEYKIIKGIITQIKTIEEELK